MNAIPEKNPHVSRIEAQADHDMSVLEKATAFVRPLDKPQASRLVVCDAGELLSKDLPPREILLSPWLQSQSLSMVYAWRGIGKTHVALGIGYALSSGGEFLSWRATAPVPVLYLDGEMPAPALKDRVARIVTSADKEAAAGMLRFVTPDLQRDGIMPNLAERDGQEAVDKIIGDARVIIVDNISCLVRGGKENEGESWQPVAEWALRQRAQGRAVVFIHHTGKTGQQRGTSKREDVLDTSILLKRPADYRPDEGARFEVHFEKARALFGQDVTPFEAKLQTDQNGVQTWTTRTVKDAADTQMIELAEMGLSQSEIAREMGINRSTVLRALRKAEEDGRYTSAKKPKRSGNIVPIRGRNDD